jgi:tRNA-splicing ligase RtcB
MTTENYNVIKPKKGVPIKAWTKGVPLEQEAEQQLKNVASMPFVYRHVAAMPDVHWGMGATIGSVIPTLGAIIPAAVGVDIGCGMMAVQTSLNAKSLPDNLKNLRTQIEKFVPHGRTHNGGRGDRGAWANIPDDQTKVWSEFKKGFDSIVEKHPKVGSRSPNHVNHLGTLGTGNHFIEVCLDESDQVWIMLHSGSRGIGNRIGTYFIELAKQDMRKLIVNLPDKNLAYFNEGAEHFDDYVFAVDWAQNFAKTNRELMMQAVIKVIKNTQGIPPFESKIKSVNCHHNYVTREDHFGENVLVTRKGAVRARKGDWGIIPGSMGAQSFIVRGLGNKDSFDSCSHGAGRAMSRSAAKKKFSLEDHIKATEGVECRKDKDVIDETPAAYKSIDAVMEAQKDLVEIVHTLRQVICVKG